MGLASFLRNEMLSRKRRKKKKRKKHYNKKHLIVHFLKYASPEIHRFMQDVPYQLTVLIT